MALSNGNGNWNVKSLPLVSESQAEMAKDAPKALTKLEEMMGHLKMPEYLTLLSALGLTEYYLED